MFRRQLFLAAFGALTLGGAVALGGVNVGNGAPVPDRVSFMTDKGGHNKFAATALAEVHTYRVRLVAYNLGSFVESCEVTFPAANELEFRNAVGNAQAGFGRSLNARH